MRAVRVACNRHCPKSQGKACREWLAARQGKLLSFPYFHMVFTLPAEVAAIAFQNKTAGYAILFKAAAETPRTIAADPKHLGAEIGLIAVLHSWGQNLHYHPISITSCRAAASLPMEGVGSHGGRASSCPCACSRACSAASSGGVAGGLDAGILKFFGGLAGLAEPAAFTRLLAKVRRLDRVVHAKPFFGGPEQVLAYLGRYTHRVAIANSWLISIADDRIAFRWRDYRHRGRTKVMTLDAHEFIRRFLLHTLPDGFRRIRHYGFLAIGHRAARLELCRRLLTNKP